MRTTLHTAMLLAILSAVGCQSAPPPVAPTPAPKPIAQSMPAAFFGGWKAESAGATETTGDISLSGTSIVLDGKKTFALTGAKGLSTDDAAALNSLQLILGSPADSFIAQVNIPHTAKFAQDTALCEKQDVKWVAGIRRNSGMGLVFFGGDAAPTITAAALASDPTFCGSYSYSRKKP
jgi:hypothetical protein